MVVPRRLLGSLLLVLDWRADALRLLSLLLGCASQLRELNMHVSRYTSVYNLPQSSLNPTTGDRCRDEVTTGAQTKVRKSIILIGISCRSIRQHETRTEIELSQPWNSPRRRRRVFDPSVFPRRGPQHLLDLFSYICLLYTSPSPRDRTRSRMPSSA